MPRKRRESKRRSNRPEPTDIEWAWLTAAPDCNGFLGFGGGRLTTRERLAEFWTEYETEIRAMWRDDPPASVPHGHPVEAEMPLELRGTAEPDPRRILSDMDGDELEKYRQRLDAWREARREWFATAGKPRATREGG